MRLPEPQDKRTRLGGYVSYPLGREPRRTPPLARLLSQLPCRKADMMAHPCCMIVEDQALIGMSLEASLEEAGFDVAGPFMSNAQALKWMESAAPDLALLDVMLKDGTSLRIARELKSRGVPFVIYSGLPPDADRPPELQDVPWLEKPARRETLVTMLEDLVEPKAGFALSTGPGELP